MIEKYLYDYLNSVLNVPVYMERPADCPKTFVLFERTGGNIRDHVKHATIAVQSYASSMYGAMSLNEEVVSFMEDAITVQEITSVKVNGYYNYTNTQTKEYRYQAVFEITYY